jgi:hypothetical protein
VCKQQNLYQQIRSPNLLLLRILKSISRKNLGEPVPRESVRKANPRRSQNQVFHQILGFQIHLSRSMTSGPSLLVLRQPLLLSVNRGFLSQLHLLRQLLSHVKCQNASLVLRSDHRKPLPLALTIRFMLRLMLRLMPKLKISLGYTLSLWLRRRWMSS